jgi:glycosyltransferase involved in cell wall biosynthesis
VDAGGQNVHVAALATELAALGHEVVVYTRREDASSAWRVPLAPGVVVEHVTAGPATYVPKDLVLPYMDEFAMQLHASWVRWRPDVVHSHFWMSGKAAVAAAWSLRIPVVHTFHALGAVKRRHQGMKDTSPAERLEVEASLMERVDCIVATCSDEVFELLRLGTGRRRVRIVPCGFDPTLFGPEGECEARSSGHKRILVVGRLVERKGIGNTIEALRWLPEAELIVAGGPDASALDSDPEVRRLRAVAAQQGVSGRVCFRGRVERTALPALYRSADVVVCAPWYEPFGIVPVEAMACGVPVVASAVGGLIDTVVDGVTGLHVPPRSPERIAEAVIALTADEGLRRRLGAEGARRMRARYTWARVASATQRVYAEIVTRTAGAAARVG